MPTVQNQLPGAVSGASPIQIGQLTKSMNGLRTFIGEKQEIIFQPLYDRVNYPQSGATQLTFFATQRGQSATLITSGSSGSRTKTLRDTNMDQPNVLSSKGFLMYGIALEYIPLSTGITSTALQNFEDDKAKISTSGYVEVKFIDKPYLDVPIYIIPAPAESRGSKATTANNTTIGGPGGYGVGAFMAPYVIDPPFLITPNENFSIIMYLDGTALSAGNSMDLQMYLIGYLLRPAQ
jgi:hypothetical protein